MSQHEVTPTEIGMIRIYLKPSDKAGRSGRPFRPAPSLYRELVARAKRDGIMHAVAHHTHYGYSSHGPVGADGFELPDPHLTMCVELIGQRRELERFCEAHGGLLADKVIVYKHLEHWRVGPSSLSHRDATLEVLKGGAP